MVENGPLSDAHAMFEKKCEVCHTQSFGGVPDEACGQCHDGAAHPAKSIDLARPTAAVRCAECHLEHRGKVKLAEVGNSNCTSVTLRNTGSPANVFSSAWIFNSASASLAWQAFASRVPSSKQASNDSNWPPC